MDSRLMIASRYDEYAVRNKTIRSVGKAAEQYLAYRARKPREKVSDNTLRHTRSKLNVLLRVIGEETRLRDLDRAMGEVYYHAISANKPRTVNGHVSQIRGFIRWMFDYGLIKDPSFLAELETLKPEDVDRQRIPEVDFPLLLDSAPDPVSRAVVAIGLYHLPRSDSETSLLRWKDVNLDAGTLTMYSPKTRKRRTLRMHPSLIGELRGYKTWYANEILGDPLYDGPLDPEYFVTPMRKKGSTGPRNGYRPRETNSIRPDVPLSAKGGVGRYAKKALAAYNEVSQNPIRLDGEAGHILRRSGARALYDHLIHQRGAANALRLTQAALGHANQEQTEVYIGLREDVDELNRLRSEMSVVSEQVDNVFSLDERRGS